MVNRLAPFIFLSLMGLAVWGCAKRPVAKSDALAPSPPAPPPASASPTPAPQAVAPQVTTPSPATPTPAITPAPAATVPRPAPREFVAIPQLKDIYFDFDKYDVRPGDARILEENAKWIKSNPSHLILIEGHADERGTNEYNLVLGERRAKSTISRLISLGLQAGRFSMISYGEEQPTCTQKNEECWAKNRRAHFLVKSQ